MVTGRWRFILEIRRKPHSVPLRGYRIAGKFGRGKVWQINSFRAFGERKFGELIDQAMGY